MREAERFLLSKTGSSSDCEDLVAVTDDFACVVDGATSQSERSWGGKSGGRLAAELICEALTDLDARSSAREAVLHLTQGLASRYRDEGLWELLGRDSLERAAATVAIFSRDKHEIWFVGDCQCLLISNSGKTNALKNSKIVDEINARARALFLEAELAAGKRLEDLLQEDTGRQFIKPLLRMQKLFQNARPESQYSYWVIDGYRVAPEGIRIVSVEPDVAEIVLATDGYPRLFPSLEETEDFLLDLIARDPLLIQPPFQSTKGVVAGNVSFDDRAYLRLKLA